MEGDLAIVGHIHGAIDLKAASRHTQLRSLLCPHARPTQMTSSDTSPTQTVATGAVAVAGPKRRQDEEVVLR